MSYGIQPVAGPLLHPGGAPVPVTAPQPSPGAVPTTTAARPPVVDRLELSPEWAPGPEPTAYGRALELALDGRELHFSTDEATGRIAVEVRTLDGETIRFIPNDEALEAFTGKID